MSETANSLTLKPIGIIQTPYGEKFAVPRQPNLVEEGKGVLRLLAPYNSPDAVRGLAQFSHLWLIFHFHHIPEREWHATVRPPRLGGNARVGVFASRATHRPNPLGLSKVALERIEMSQGEVKLHLGSVDLVNGTPIFDIKPYLAYADSEPLAESGFAQHKPPAPLQVKFTSNAEQAVRSSPHFASYGITDPLRFIQEVLAQDPRPAYLQGKIDTRQYGMHLACHNILWQFDPENSNQVWVIDVKPIL